MPSIDALNPTWLADDSDAFATNLTDPGNGDRTVLTGTTDDADGTVRLGVRAGWCRHNRHLYRGISLHRGWPVSVGVDDDPPVRVHAGRIGSPGWRPRL